MRIAALTVDVRRLWPGEAPLDQALAFVDLDATGEAPGQFELPPCPLIGLGNPAHPLAASLDAVIAAPVTAAALAEQVLAMPQAAEVIVGLLRILPSLAPDAGLTAESLAYGVLQGSAAHRDWIAAQAPAPQRTEGRVQLDRTGDCLTITLDHPASGNAIDRAMRDQLHDALLLGALDPDVRQVVLRGAGRTFSLGAELCEFGTTGDPATAHAIRARTLPARAAARCADKLAVHVKGGCVGAGLELAAWARHVTATSNSWFQLPELAMGILPGAGGCVSLTRRIGRQRTLLLILSGKRLSAKQALDWGLIDAIVDEPSGDDRGADIG